jgi:hypothetical protein
VGSAWINDEGLITIYLDSYPVPDEKGVVKFSLFEQRPREDAPQQGARQTTRAAAPRAAPQQTLAEDLDDEIPF